MTLTGSHDYDRALPDADRELMDAAETVAYLHAHGRLTADALDTLHDTVARRDRIRGDYVLRC